MVLLTGSCAHRIDEMKRVRTSSLPLHASSGSDPYRPRKQIHRDFIRIGGGPAPSAPGRRAWHGFFQTFHLSERPVYRPVVDKGRAGLVDK
jgi:hypothetical protein